MFVTFQERSDVLIRIAKVVGAPRVPTVDDFVRYGLLLKVHDGTQEGPYDLIDQGQISWAGVYHRFLAVTGLTDAQLPEYRFWALFCRHMEPIINVSMLLRELNNRGIPLIVVSNGEFGSQHAADLISFHYGVEWAGGVVSSLVGYKKPHRTIWDAALRVGQERVPDLRPEEMIYVDDIPRYCDAFKAHFPGSRALCFNGVKDSVIDLRCTLRLLGLPV